MKPTLEKNEIREMNLTGFIGQQIQATLENWLLTTPYANPAMIETFRYRDRNPRPLLVEFYGEFAGKYLTSAGLLWRITRDKRLYKLINYIVDQLADVQSKEGYLGPHPYHERLIGKPPKGLRTQEEVEAILKNYGSNGLWDIWGHYHCMLGLLLWHEATGNKKAIEVCIKAADYICDFFLTGSKDIIEAGWLEMNLAVIHAYCLLYQVTKKPLYLKMIKYIEKKWEHPRAGDYVRTALQGKEFFETPKPRWESLHNLQAIAELYLMTNDAKYLKAFEHTWWSILKYDRHNTGGFSSGEGAVGNPYDQGAIETCCTIAWIALTVDMLCLTGESYTADELELSTFNGMLGAQHPSGRWWTYNTPMDGQRRAFYHDANWQCLAGSPELGCCTVNGPRGLGMLREWALMNSKEGIVLNYYGPGTINSTLKSGQSITIQQITEYPVSGDIEIKIGLQRPQIFILKLRIPIWSVSSQVTINGEDLEKPTAGTYFELKRNWKNEDIIKLSLDMSLHFWPGEKEVETKTSIYRGPILLAYDQRYNEMDPDDIPVLDCKELSYEMLPWDNWLKPWLLLRFKAKDGRNLYLCDFASAGAVGTHYVSWLPVKGLQPVSFNKKNPVWNVRI